MHAYSVVRNGSELVIVCTRKFVALETQDIERALSKICVYRRILWLLLAISSIIMRLNRVLERSLLSFKDTDWNVDLNILESITPLWLDKLRKDLKLEPGSIYATVMDELSSKDFDRSAS